jgi:dihydroorotase
LLAVTLAHVHNGAVPLPVAIDLLTAQPAALLGIAAGRIAKGAPADLCLFEPERVWKVEAGRLPGKAQNTPFDGRALEGVVLGTWKRGKRVFG